MTVSASQSASESASVLVRKTSTFSEQHGRTDLVGRLRHTTRRLGDPSVRVLVVGEFKQGKSQLINALVGAPVCPVDDDIATAVPTEVGYGAQPAASLLLASKGAPEAARPEEAPVDIGTLAAYITNRRDRDDGRRVVGARALLPRKLLQDGLLFVDTPGVGGLASTHATSTLAALPSADAVILVSDASSEFTAPEVTFLRQALNACPTVVCVLTKTDLFPEWRRVLDIDRGHLSRLGLELPILPISSALRLEAAARNDASLNDESRFPALVRHLYSEVLSRRDQLLLRSTTHDVLSVVDNLRLTLGAERDALEDPTAIPEMVAQLNNARARAEELKRRSARWQSTLADGVADLNADLDHDLRDRIRVVLREAEGAIDTGDPGVSWEEFARWFEQRISSALADTFLWADRNANWLLEEVGQHFAEDSETATPEFHLHDTSGLVDPVNELGQLDTGQLNTLQKMLVGLRGSYGGILMFGLITGLAGVPLVNPISVGAGLVLGTKAYRDDADQRLRRRRAEAKSLVRKYSDDVIFYVSKQLRDRLRVVQRIVRDHYSEVADELSRSLQESVSTAQKAAASSVAERKDRLGQVNQALAQLDELSSQAKALSQSRAKSAGAQPRPGTTTGSRPPAGPGSTDVVPQAPSTPQPTRTPQAPHGPAVPSGTSAAHAQ